jgi:hypothetical protein
MKIMNTQDQTIVNALKIQPTGQLLAAGGTVNLQGAAAHSHNHWHIDDFGSLLFFDLSAQAAVKPLQTRQILPEHGGIAEICWISDHAIAVGTTRGKIIVYGNQNSAVSLSFLSHAKPTIYV